MTSVAAHSQCGHRSDVTEYDPGLMLVGHWQSVVSLKQYLFINNLWCIIDFKSVCVAVAVAINRALLSETRCCGGSGEGDGAARGSGTEAEVGKADGEREGLLEGAEKGQASETARE